MGRRRVECERRPVILRRKTFMKLSNFCPKCGKSLLVCLCLAVAGGAPVAEPLSAPAEECRLSVPCSFGDLWAPHGEEHDYGTTQPAMFADPPGGSTTAAPLPPWGWSDATNGVAPRR